MTKYVIRRVTVSEVEVLTEDDEQALQHAQSFSPGLEKYYFEKLALRFQEQHLEIVRREAPPVCGINDEGKSCEEPVKRLHAKLEQRLCERHYETMKSA